MSKDKLRRSQQGYENHIMRVRACMKARYELARENGTCYRCGNICLINFKTGKPYHACVDCRRVESVRQAKIRNSPQNGDSIDKE